MSPSRTELNARLYSSTPRTVMWAISAILARRPAAPERLAARASMSSQAVTTIERPVVRSTMSCPLHRPGISMSAGTAVLRNSSMAASRLAGLASVRVSRTPAPAAGRLRRTNTGTS